MHGPKLLQELKMRTENIVDSREKLSKEHVNSRQNSKLNNNNRGTPYNSWQLKMQYLNRLIFKIYKMPLNRSCKINPNRNIILPIGTLDKLKDNK